jgi:hypothetical protein
VDYHRCVRIVRTALLSAVAAALGAVPAWGAPDADESASPSAPLLRYEDGRLTARLEGVPLPEVVDALRRATGATITGDVDASLVQQHFDRVPIRQALDQFLRLANFILTYEDGRLVSIQLLGTAVERPAAPAAAPLVAPAAVGAPPAIATSAAASGPTVLGRPRTTLRPPAQPLDARRQVAERRARPLRFRQGRAQAPRPATAGAAPGPPRVQ